MKDDGAVVDPATAWAAGLFEGEGSIDAKKNGSGPRGLRLQLTSTDEDVVRRFHEVVGVGHVGGPYTRDRDGVPWKAEFKWACVGNDAKALLERLLPYLGSRRQETANQVLGQIDFL